MMGTSRGNGGGIEILKDVPISSEDRQVGHFSMSLTAETLHHG